MTPTRTFEFDTTFRAITGVAPFPWQEALYERFVSDSPDNIPKSCSLPTGLGKTLVVAIWLIALASRPDKMPRRLVYVVNRRTVVDQATDEAKKLRDNLCKPELAEIADRLRDLIASGSEHTDSPPLAISTLRGQFADNREWSIDPTRPAVIVGTVDMIGSRLLFSGYGISFKSKPLHAGFLGQDVLLVHDEAHLEPAFQNLLIAIENEQKREPSQFGEKHRLKVMELSATPRGKDEVFTLTAEDERNEVVQKRICAKKSIVLHQLDDEKKLPARIVDLALNHKDSKRPILVFVRSVEAVEKVTESLRKAKQRVEPLTGTLRGKERDELVEKAVFRRFLPNADVGDGTVYLVCTSAGEVGVNISADHLVCDLSTFDSMAQRFGRVNRFGDCDDTRIDVVPNSGLPSEKDIAAERAKELTKRKPSVFIDGARRRTLELLQQLNGDGSPDALRKLDPHRRQEAFTPDPKFLLTSDILFDAWALTTVCSKLPGRPPVAEYLHGVSEWEPPQTAVAWREEVGLICDDLLDQYEPEDLVEDYPLKPHELLKDRTDRIFKQLEKIAARGNGPVWVIERDGSVRVTTLAELVDTDKDDLNGVTLLLRPEAGGLQDGLLNGNSEIANDVADDWFADAERKIHRRIRVWDDDDQFDQKTKDMRSIRTIQFAQPDDDEDATGRSWLWYELPRTGDSDGSKSAQEPISWQHHTNDVTKNAEQIVRNLPLSEELKHAVILAATFHDLGKKRKVWQRSIGNHDFPNRVLAKTGGKMKPRELTDYRHEFGSLIDVRNEPEFKTLRDKPEMQDLILYLVAVHHGYGRPHFPNDRAFDPERPQILADETAREIPRRFARLQRKYGRWGLAYLESLLRAADYAASAKPTEVES